MKEGRLESELRRLRVADPPPALRQRILEAATAAPAPAWGSSLWPELALIGATVATLTVAWLAGRLPVDAPSSGPTDLVVLEQQLTPEEELILAVARQHRPPVPPVGVGGRAEPLRAQRDSIEGLLKEMEGEPAC